MSGERKADLECAKIDIIFKDGERNICRYVNDIPFWSVRNVLTREEEIDVIANDLAIELRGRIDRGATFGIGGGAGVERMAGSD